MPDIKLPDGRLIQGVPEGTTKEQLTAKLLNSGVLKGDEDWLKPAQPEMGRGEAAFVSATNPLGFGDEVKAGLAASVAKLFGGAATKDIDIGDLYKEARDNERMKQQQAREKYPVQSFAGQMFSDVGIAGKALAGAGLAGEGLKTAVKGGAALGASSALGETKDITDVPQVAKDVALGATVGGLTGGAVQQAIPAAISATSAISQAPKKLLQKALGVKPEAVKTFQELGINPTLADVSSSASLQNFVKDIPGGGKPITEALQKQVNEISKQIQGVVPSKGGTYSQAGKEILKGADDILEKSKLRSEQLYGKVNEFIPAETPVSMNNTFKALDDRKVQITSAVSGGKVAGYSKFINDIKNNIAQGKEVPYDSLTSLRSEVGSAMQGKLEPQERAAINKIYSGLTNDIKENIQRSDLDKIGKESALKAWERANASHRIRTNFIKENIQPLIDKGTPEEVYRHAMSQSKLGGTKVNQVMRSLNPNQKDFVRATVIRDMGLAPKTAQGAEGDIFSPQKFMGEFNAFRKTGTEKSLFTPEQITAFNRLNKIIELTKNTEQAGKSNVILPLIGLTSIGTATGGVGLIPAVGGARLTANLMANPKFVNWLATSANSAPKEFPKHLNKLSAIAAANPDVREEILGFIGSVVGSSDAKSEEPTMSEDQIRQQLIQQQEKEPLLMGGVNIDQESKKIKQRFYRD